MAVLKPSAMVVVRSVEGGRGMMLTMHGGLEMFARVEWSGVECGREWTVRVDGGEFRTSRGCAA